MADFLAAPSTIKTIDASAMLVQSAAGNIQPVANEGWIVAGISTNNTVKFTDGTNLTSAVTFPGPGVGGCKIYLSNANYLVSQGAVTVSAAKLAGPHVGRVKSGMLAKGSVFQPPAGEIWAVTFILFSSAGGGEIDLYDGTTGVFLTSSTWNFYARPFLISNTGYLRWPGTSSSVQSFISAIKVN